MPKSTRCGTCNTPIKGHARRDTTKATRIVAKKKKLRICGVCGFDHKMPCLMGGTKKDYLYYEESF